MNDTVNDDIKSHEPKNNQEVTEQNKVFNNDKRHYYSKEELIAISKLPCCRTRPKCLELNHNNKSGLWDPDIWAQKISQNHASSNLLLKLSNGSIKRDRVLELNEKNGALKKRADLRDRLKEESQHDIILSPQRRSFDTGCHIAPNKNDNLRSSRNENHSHHQERRDLDYNVHRNENAGNGGRRLGMNRLIGQRDKGIDWGKSREYRDQEEMDIRRNNSRYSRFDYDSRRQMGNSRNNRCHRDAKHDHNRSLEEDEPEWYVGGPTSQNDTIELKGFEEDGSYHDSKNDHSSRSYSTDHSNRPNSRGPTSSKSDVYFNDHFCSKNGNLENLNAHYPNMFQNNSQDIDSNETNSKEKLKEDFDINEMFKLDNWRNMSSLSNENVSSIPINSEYSNESNSGTSRFAQWFSENKTDRQSPIDRLFANATFTSSNNSRRSSLHEDHLGSIVASADSSSSSLKIPFNRGNHAPIFEKKHQSNDGKVLLNILKKANINVNELIHQQPALPLIKLDQAKSVAELEAGLQNASSSNFKDSENDKNVLNKLLSRLEKSLATLKMNQDSNEKTMVQFSQNERNPPVNHSSHVLDILKEQSVKNRSNKILETLKSSLFDREKDQLLKNKLSHSKEEIFESSQSFESSSGGEAPIENQFSDSNAFFSNVDPIFSNCPINTGTVHNKVNKEDYIVEKKLNINDARNSISASSKIKSANISAFTPTSVIRKIASEKDKEAIRKVVSLDQALDGNQTDSLLTSQNRSNFDNELDEDAVKSLWNQYPQASEVKMMVKLMEHQRLQKNSQRHINTSASFSNSIYSQPNHRVQNLRQNASSNIKSFVSSTSNGGQGNNNPNLNINLIRSMMQAASLPPVVSASHLSIGRHSSTGINQLAFPMLQRPHVDPRGLPIFQQARGIQRMSDLNSRRQ